MPRKGRSRYFNITRRRRTAFKNKLRMLVRRRRRRGTRSLRSLPMTGFAKSKMVLLKYVDTVTIDAGTGAPASFYIKSNSLYDPQALVGGHQPLGHDQWSTIYKNYTVLSCKMMVQALPQINSTDTSLNPGMFGLMRATNTTFNYASTNQVVESKQGGNAKLFGPGSTLVRGSNPRTTVKQSMKKHFGISSVLDPGEYTGKTGDLGTGSDPENKAYLALWVGNVAGNDPQRYVFQINLEFIAVYTNPHYLAPS